MGMQPPNQDSGSLKAAEGDEFKVEGAVVMSRDANGDVDLRSVGQPTLAPKHDG
jgi:hypothetical protein